jgi:hypothetical protein
MTIIAMNGVLILLLLLLLLVVVMMWVMVIPSGRLNDKYDDPQSDNDNYNDDGFN